MKIILDLCGGTGAWCQNAINILRRFIISHIIIRKGNQEERQKTAKEIFDKFDEYSCIKNDKWYIELKEKYLRED